jgi:hypothetical protein
VSGDTKYVTLDCGCEILIRQEWEYGCAGDCHPGSWEWSGGLIETPCALHTPAAGDVCPFDCDSCHDPEECPCENCERCRE